MRTTTPSIDYATPDARPGAQRALLVLACVLLVCVLVRGSGTGVESQANAQSRSGQGAPAMVNPADQRNSIVHELQRLNDQIEALRRQLETGRGVKVEVVTKDDAPRR